jgi:coproporphyrinogen III oxidase-like Fe-S oxidoreductase
MLPGTCRKPVSNVWRAAALANTKAYASSGAQCVHNLNYWQFGDYLGIGAGAHAKISGIASSSTFDVRRRWKVRAPRGYLEHAGTARGIGGDDAIAAQRLPFEFMLHALRLNSGFALDDFTGRTGLDPIAMRPQLDNATRRGWLETVNGQVRATQLGQRFLNDVVASFLPV